MVDGWEMGGEFMPSPSDHPLPLDERIVSKCGHRVEKTLFRSSQNGALIQYRVPIPGQGFALRVHYTKNPKRELHFHLNQFDADNLELQYSLQRIGGRNIRCVHSEQSRTSH
jgi:hypothetical protein